MEDVLNSNAAANVFGCIDPSGGWRALHGPSEARPAHVDGEVLTYEDYVDRVHCEPAGMQQLPKVERDALWKKISGARRAASRKFTFPGEAGEKYAYLVEEQRKCLTIKEGAAPTYYSIIPSFFHFINTLSELHWPFTLIFRTFGSDLDSVLKEWKQFVDGDHICKSKGTVLEELRKNYIDPATGCVYRDARHLYLCLGPSVSATTRSSALTHMEDATPDAIEKELYLVEGCQSVRQTSFKELNELLLAFYRTSNNIGGLVDYYPCWAQGAERRSGGKVFPVESKGSQDHYYVFFDDNIFISDEKSIVDLRDIRSGESLLGEKVELPFCVHVNAYKAIVEETYFLDCLCERMKLQDSLIH
ncbi:hypothetical protein STCU_05322 [Strigomonas culicis]|uniref:Uncharacterized protein n=2 Tax=Strigomonas culicis TaxID=28005 RepID=S9UGL6_9TRYP|nr:hypothetical protein STCU_05322 [Strigomonas culicis]|eukprot:EPY28058.1 hypothetical protein STCU_05322 [Strigomonas culicis]